MESGRIERRCSRQPIPDDLILEVLVRLPVKSLLRFRCVSKTWRSLISDPHLILSHRRRSQQHPLVLVKEWNLYGGDKDGKATYAPTSGATLLRTYYDFTGVNRISDTTVRVYSSSPDLICIQEVREVGSRFTLLNPTTRERVTLPEFSSGNTTFLRYMGFGYVPSLRKFKVARFFGHADIDHGSGRQVVEERCAVLTVGVDRSWRPAGGPPFMITGDQMAFVNGALHMTLTPSTEEGSGLATLDLETEAWRVIRMPRGVGTYNNIRVREQRGLLFLDHFPEAGKVEVWAMKDYEKGGWEMEHRIDLKRLQMPREFGMFLPVLIGEDGRILIFIDWRALLWYDPRDQKVAPFSPHGGHSVVRPSPLVQVENYLPLNGWD